MTSRSVAKVTPLAAFEGQGIDLIDTSAHLDLNSILTFEAAVYELTYPMDLKQTSWALCLGGAKDSNSAQALDTILRTRPKPLNKF